jgi:hypothetical protein
MLNSQGWYALVCAALAVGWLLFTLVTGKTFIGFKWLRRVESPRGYWLVTAIWALVAVEGAYQGIAPILHS